MVYFTIWRGASEGEGETETERERQREDQKKAKTWKDGSYFTHSSKKSPITSLKGFQHSTCSEETGM
jgi:hypothetical protein